MSTGRVCRLVCHAAAASMRSVLQDWNLMVTQLEHQLRTGRLTLQVSVHLLYAEASLCWLIIISIIALTF